MGQAVAERIHVADVVVQAGATGVTEDERRTALMECLDVFTTLWKERQKAPAKERLDFVTGSCSHFRVATVRVALRLLVVVVVVPVPGEPAP